MKTYKEICRKFLGTPFIHVFAFRYNKENTDHSWVLQHLTGYYFIVHI